MSGKVGSNTGPRMKARRLIHGVGRNTLLEVVRSPIYLVWANMIKRCYAPALKDHKSYLAVSVCEDWHDFANFKAWAEKHYKPGLHLDKDLSKPGASVYSPETCAFIPQSVNNIARRYKRSGSMALGVKKVHDGRPKPYSARMGRLKHIGYFATEQEAHQAWQRAKADAIEEELNSYMENSYNGRVAATLQRLVDKLRDDADAGRETTATNEEGEDE